MTCYVQVSGQIGCGGVVVQSQVTASARRQELERGEALLLVHISAQCCNIDRHILRRGVLGLEWSITERLSDMF